MSNTAQNRLSRHNSICFFFPGTYPRRTDIYICMPSQLHAKDAEPINTSILSRNPKTGPQNLKREIHTPENSQSDRNIRRRKMKPRESSLPKIGQRLVKRRPWSRATRALSQRQLLYPLRRAPSARAVRTVSELALPCTDKIR